MTLLNCSLNWFVQTHLLIKCVITDHCLIWFGTILFGGTKMYSNYSSFSDTSAKTPTSCMLRAHLGNTFQAELQSRCVIFPSSSLSNRWHHTSRRWWQTEQQEFVFHQHGRIETQANWLWSHQLRTTHALHVGFLSSSISPVGNTVASSNSHIKF